MIKIYDDATQAKIDFIQNQIEAISLEIVSQYNDATSINRLEMERQINPYFNPVRDSPEVQMLQKRLADVYTYAVPRYLLSVEEYERMIHL